MVGRHLPRLRHPDHRARLQPPRRRAARRLRSEAEALVDMALLDIENLSVDFPTTAGVMHAVNNVDVRLEEGEVLGIVGESGSGKSVTMLALMGLVAYPGQITADRLAFADQDLLTLSAGERRRLTGKDLAMIFQEPTTSLNPCFTIGFQLQETLPLHERPHPPARRRRAIHLPEQGGSPAPDSQLP